MPDAVARHVVSYQGTVGTESRDTLFTQQERTYAASLEKRNGLVSVGGQRRLPPQQRMLC
jgi:hypothetical protein